MRAPAPPIFPIFRSQLQADALVRLLLGGNEESVSSLASAIGADVGNTHREVERLERAGIIISRRVGKTRLVKANMNAPFYRPLYDLVLVTVGPAHVLAETLADLSDIETAAIFGSWAARMTGEEGPAPQDIDLLVVGKPNRDDLYDRTTEASATLGRQVNAVVVSPEKWRNMSDGFLQEITSRPQIPVLTPDNRVEEDR